MDFQLSNITMPVAALLASLIGATATITATLIQLRIAWRKEMKARERGQPVTKQARRGPVVAIIVLLIASAVGGFALSQYLVTGKKKDADLLRSEFNTKLDQLNAAAERLERLGHGGLPPHDTSLAAVTATLPPCHACSEQEAAHVTLCVSVPAAASIGTVELFSRTEGSGAAWIAHTADMAPDTDAGRYTGQPYERLESDTHKQLCQDYLHWDDVPARSLRLVAHHTQPAQP